MRRLITVELTRLLWRRAVLVLLAALVVLPVVIGVFTVVSKSAPGGDDFAEAERLAAEEAQRPETQAELQRCLDDPENYVGGGIGDQDPQQFCEEFVLPQPEWYLDYNRLDLVAEREETGLAVVFVVGLLSLLVGTTFVGHDWNTGSMVNQVLFVPQRLRVWAAKAVAVVLTTLVASAVGATLLWLVLAARYVTAGADLPPGALLDGLQQGWRGAAVAAVGGLGGYALTMLSRSTVFTLGLLFGVAVAGGIVIGVVVDDPGWFNPGINVQAVSDNGTTYYVEPDPSCFADGAVMFEDDEDPCSGQKRRTLAEGVVYLALLTGAVGGASAASFRRRDV